MLRFCLLLLLIVAGCEKVKINAPPARPHAQPAAPLPVAPAPVRSPNDFDDAVNLARGNGRLIFVYVGARWCEPCQHMQRTTLADPFTRQRLSHYVELHADYDRDRALAARLQVHGVPSYFVLSSQGEIIRRGSGYRGPAEFRAWLQD